MISGIPPSDKLTCDTTTTLWLWGYLGKFEAKYSPQARLAPSLLSHKRISEPEGTSKKETCLPNCHGGNSIQAKWAPSTLLHIHKCQNYLFNCNNTYSFISQTSLQRKEKLINV